MEKKKKQTCGGFSVGDFARREKLEMSMKRRPIDGQSVRVRNAIKNPVQLGNSPEFEVKMKRNDG